MAMMAETEKKRPTTPCISPMFAARIRRAVSTFATTPPVGPNVSATGATLWPTMPLPAQVRSTPESNIYLSYRARIVPSIPAARDKVKITQAPPHHQTKRRKSLDATAAVGSSADAADAFSRARDLHSFVCLKLQLSVLG